MDEVPHNTQDHFETFPEIISNIYSSAADNSLAAEGGKAPSPMKIKHQPPTVYCQQQSSGWKLMLIPAGAKYKLCVQCRLSGQGNFFTISLGIKSKLRQVAAKMMMKWNGRYFVHTYKKLSKKTLFSYKIYASSCWTVSGSEYDKCLIRANKVMVCSCTKLMINFLLKQKNKTTSSKSAFTLQGCCTCTPNKNSMVFQTDNRLTIDESFAHLKLRWKLSLFSYWACTSKSCQKSCICSCHTV